MRSVILITRICHPRLCGASSSSVSVVSVQHEQSVASSAERMSGGGGWFGCCAVVVLCCVVRVVISGRNGMERARALAGVSTVLFFLFDVFDRAHDAAAAAARNRFRRVGANLGQTCQPKTRLTKLHAALAAGGAAACH